VIAGVLLMAGVARNWNASACGRTPDAGSAGA
jgi:hypothetical protein